MSVQFFIRSILGGMLGLGLIIALFFTTGLSFTDLHEFLQSLNWQAFAGIVVCTFFYVVLGGMKWHLIAGMRGPRAFFYTYYTGQAMLIGQFLPPPVAIAIPRLKKDFSTRFTIWDSIFSSRLC
jgi:hypothetical protein